MHNSHRRIIGIALLCAFMGYAIGCSQRPNDEEMAKDIQKKIAADPETKDSQVEVAAKDGNVKVTGRVRTPAAKKKVEEIAHEEPGAASLDDETTVAPAAVTPVQQLGSAMAAAPPPVEKPKPQPVIVPSGTVLTVKTNQVLSSKTSQAGQTFLASLAQPVSVGGRPALPTGATVNGRVVHAKAKGKIKGEGELALALTSISLGDHTYPIETTVISSSAKGKGKRTAATTGGGAAGGALIGGLAGGGKGAGIGALVGAGAGFIGGTLTGNKQIEIPAESALSFTLTSPLTLPPPPE